MKTAALVFVILAAIGTCMGLVPCMGWANWFAVPTSAMAAILGLIGLLQAGSTADQSEKNTYLAALIVGALCIVVGTVRCLLGGGVV